MAHPAEQEGLALNPTRVWSYAPSWPTAARSVSTNNYWFHLQHPAFSHARLKSMFTTGGCISSATLSHFGQNADLVNWLFFACTQVHILELLPCTPVFDFVKKYHCHFLMSTLLWADISIVSTTQSSWPHSCHLQWCKQVPRVGTKQYIGVSEMDCCPLFITMVLWDTRREKEGKRERKENCDLDSGTLVKRTRNHHLAQTSEHRATFLSSPFP